MASEDFLLGLMGALQAGNVGMETYTKERRYRDQMAERQADRDERFMERQGERDYRSSRDASESSYRQERGEREDLGRFGSTYKEAVKPDSAFRKSYSEQMKSRAGGFDDLNEAVRVLEVYKDRAMLEGSAGLSPAERERYEAAGDFVSGRFSRGGKTSTKTVPPPDGKAATSGGGTGEFLKSVREGVGRHAERLFGPPKQGPFAERAKAAAKEPQKPQQLYGRWGGAPDAKAGTERAPVKMQIQTPGGPAYVDDTKENRRLAEAKGYKILGG